MPIIYTDANPRTVAYVIDGGGSGYSELPGEYTSMEAEYVAIIYALNEYYLKWNKELDSRQYNASLESDGEFYKVASPASETPRPLPPPVQIRCDNETVVKQLSRQWHIKAANLRRLAQTVWKMAENVEVVFEWVSRKDNPAGKMLK